MINKRKKQFCAELAISSPPRLANFVKPRLPVNKPRALSALTTIDNVIPKTIGLAVSVIIPMFNAEKYIGECLNSLLEQTFQNFEVIVVDDCSTDNSVQVVEEYAPKFDGRLSLYRLEENSGHPGKVRNIGISHARGEYISLLDADDFLLSNALETFYSAAKKFEADVVYNSAYHYMKAVDYNEVYRDGLGTKLRKKNIDDKITLILNEPNKILQQLLFERNFNFPWSYFVRRDFLAKNQITFPETLSSGEDHLWVIQVYCYAKRFLRIQSPFYFYRRYTNESICTMEREAHEQITYFLSTFTLWLETADALSRQIEILRDNPTYLLAAAQRHFAFCIERTDTARKKLKMSDLEAFKRLYNEFANREDPADFVMLFRGDIIDKNGKFNRRVKNLDELKDEIDQFKAFKNSSGTPAVSVIIPMYNAEEFIGECLYSLFWQTFHDFEIIIVDDCSTDNSVAVVESYIPKFSGHLRLKKLETNSGAGGYRPRNEGIKLARGEYAYFMDADDFLLLTALEMLYNLAKQYDTDVIYSSTYFDMLKQNDLVVHRDRVNMAFLREGKEDEPTLTVDDPDKIFEQLLFDEREGNFSGPWTKLVRRDFLIENEILFPTNGITCGGDFIWVIHIYCKAKRFLRISTPFYFYRCHESFTAKTKGTPTEHVSYWIAAFVDFAKAFDDLMNKVDFLKEHPEYCYGCFSRHFKWHIGQTHEVRKHLSSKEIYTALYNKFSEENRSVAFVMSFFFTLIDADKKIGEERWQTIKKLNNDINRLKKLSMIPYPAISVIIPMYNAADYIGECLDSLLAQSFQNFEIIVVDDCSTDNSPEIVKGYMPKFNGHLSLAKTETNSGGCAVPRNVGFPLSRGEYIFFMDSDDVLTKTGLEEMFLQAKDYNADVVYCERYYMSEGVGEDFLKNIHIANYRVQGPPYVNKPTLEPEDLSLRLQKMLSDRYWVTAWLKLVRRDLLEENNIVFSHVKPSEDEAWTYGLVFFAKRFLRVPNMVYIRRMRDDSIMGTTRTPQQMMNFCLAPVMLGMKNVDDLMNRHEFFQANPSYRYSVLEYYLRGKLNWAFREAGTLRSEKVYEAIKDEFGEKLGEHSILISALCSALYKEKSQSILLEKCKTFITARIDIKLLTTKGDLQIVSVSNENANVSKPGWFQNNGIGYIIASFAGSLTFVVKATVNGQINLQLKGVWVPNPADKTKRLPYWIDYTKLVVNKRTILNKLTPAWHDKPYSYKINAKANEKITIDVEWLPHNFIEQKALLPPPPSPELIPNKFRNYLTARIDLNLLTTEGDFKIISTSDSKAKISQPSFMKEERIGYIITSLAGSLTLVAKATVDGQLNLKLRGMYVSAPEDKSKAIPYWIDYTALTVNNETIVDTLTPAWHDKPYVYNTEVKADEKITIKATWLPHMGDFIEQKVLPPPPKVESIPDKFRNYLTARIDLNLLTTEGDFKIISTSDSKAKISQPSFMKEGRIGYIITSLAGSLTLVAKATVDGQLNLKLRGVYVSAPEDKSKAIPYWIDYTALTVNDETIVDTLTPAWHDKPYIYNTAVKADEEITIKIEWLPHRSKTKK